MDPVKERVLAECEDLAAKLGCQVYSELRTVTLVCLPNSMSPAAKVSVREIRSLKPFEWEKVKLERLERFLALLQRYAASTTSAS